MTNLHPAELATVVGGSTKSKKDDLTLQLTTLQNSLKDLTANPGGGNNNNMMLMMVMAMAMKPAPTVVTAGAPAPAAVVGGPVVNIRTAIRRG